MTNVNIDILEAYYPLLEPACYKAYSSGRSAGKSWSFARVLLIKALQEKCLILCCREVQTSIKDSVYRLLVNQINLLNLSQHFEIKVNGIKCLLTGTEFIFKGMKDARAAESIRSLEGIKYCWVEEAQSLSQNSLDILTPTIRLEGSEIWFSMNARFPTDPVWKTFFTETPPPNSIVRRTTYKDNPKCPQTSLREAKYAKSLSESRYQHIWLGELITGYGNVFKREWFRHWNPDKIPNYALLFITADTAFSKTTTADYSVFQLWGVTSDLNNLDLLDSIKGKWSYPELLTNCKNFYSKHSGGGVIFPYGEAVKLRAPLGQAVIENKGSGISLIQTLDLEGEIPTLAYNPGPRDPVNRAHDATPYVHRGHVRIPPIEYAGWVEDFVAECVSFREDMRHAHDDQVVALEMAVSVWIGSRGSFK